MSGTLVITFEEEVVNSLECRLIGLCLRESSMRLPRFKLLQNRDLPRMIDVVLNEPQIMPATG
jgi:hypothetical protein